jgi:hypothetical protein
MSGIQRFTVSKRVSDPGGFLFPSIYAAGGTVTDVGGYRVHTFSSTGSSTFSISAVPNLATKNIVEYLIVAGGGGGAGAQRAGAGGAGGLIYGSTTPGPNSYSLTVGIGGNAGPYDAQNNGEARGTNGSNSIMFNLTSIGGGRGGCSDGTGTGPSSGGSGGGGWYAQGAGGAGTPGQGNSGGTAGTSAPYAGGGGGAGGAGGNFNAVGGPVGGVGLQYSISGTATYYAGGGSGSNFGVDSGYAGGLGGGGIGRNSSSATTPTAPSNGTDGLGGGGGSSGKGGSGVIIVRYLL